MSTLKLNVFSPNELVSVKWSKDCHDALKSVGVKTEMHLIEGAGHIAAAMNPSAILKACNFLKQELQAKNE